MLLKKCYLLDEHEPYIQINERQKKKKKVNPRDFLKF